jgi:hypothetical protein
MIQLQKTREEETERLKAESAARIAALESGEVELDVETEEEKVHPPPPPMPPPTSV